MNGKRVGNKPATDSLVEIRRNVFIIVVVLADAVHVYLLVDAAAVCSKSLQILK